MYNHIEVLSIFNCRLEKIFVTLEVMQTEMKRKQQQQQQHDQICWPLQT